MRIYSKRFQYPEHAVLVDRSTIFGNPFTVARYGREQALREFTRWFMHPDRKALRDAADQQLAGHDLVCWCAPDAHGLAPHDPLHCHAQVLAAWCERYVPEEVQA